MSESTVPKVSVVIPVFNGENHILRCLDSILGQGFEDIEVVLVDDASTDGSLSVLDEAASRDPRLLVIGHPENRGQGTARNTGIESCSGEYVMFVDIDDTLEDGCIGELVGRMDDDDADVYAFGVNTVDDRGEKEHYHGWNGRSSGLAEGLKHFSVYQIASPVWNKIYRKSFLDEERIRFVDYYYHEDILFTALIALRCRRYVSTDERYYNYHSNCDSTTQRPQTLRHLASYFFVYSELQKLFEEAKAKSIEDDDLFHLIARNYGSAEFFPKVVRYASERTDEAFRKDVRDAAAEVFGSSGYFISDTIAEAFSRHCKRIDADVHSLS